MSSETEGALHNSDVIDRLQASAKLPPWARRLISRLLNSIKIGQIVIETPAGYRIEHTGPQSGPRALVKIRRWRMLARMLMKGDIGFAESYMDGDWSSPDLTAVIELAARNRESMDTVLRGNRLVRWLPRLRHMMRSNTRSGSKRNIQEHYDLGNDFYRMWLDSGMTYSSALYEDLSLTLENAQEAKLDRIATLLELKDGESVLEIGCGWGGLAEKLVRDRNCRVTGLTLSPAQLTFANERLQAADLAGRSALRLQDYRDVTGKFDRIVSIEMLEAVGESYWPSYFAKLRDCLRAGGAAVLQVITITEGRFSAYRDESDFIQQYIFPGGMLLTNHIIRQQAEAHGLRLEAVQFFGESYARTLHEWRVRFNRNWTEIRKMGFTPKFKRMWEYYLAYCEAGFRAGILDVGLYRLVPQSDASAN